MSFPGKWLRVQCLISASDLFLNLWQKKILFLLFTTRKRERCDISQPKSASASAAMQLTFRYRCTQHAAISYAWMIQCDRPLLWIIMMTSSTHRYARSISEQKRKGRWLRRIGRAVGEWRSTHESAVIWDARCGMFHQMSHQTERIHLSGIAISLNLLCAAWSAWAACFSHFKPDVAV